MCRDPSLSVSLSLSLSLPEFTVLSGSSFVLLMISALTMCMHQESTFPFFRLHYTVILWCQIAALVALTATTLFVMTKEKMNAALSAAPQSGRNVEDGASLAFGKMVTFVARMLFTPFLVLSSVRTLLHRVVETLEGMSCGFLFDWGDLCTDEGFEREGLVGWLVQAGMVGLKQVLALPVMLVYHLLLCVSVLFRPSR
jgi:hypothetical protein